MASPTVSVRCPVCGTNLTVVLAPEPPTQWFPCPNCHAPMPVVVPRDPPPLYSWEVLPGLYPPMLRPRVPRWRARRTVAAALFLVTVLAAALGAVLVWDGYAATTPAAFTVDGTVARDVGGVTEPLAGATVVLTDDAGAASTELTGASGSFSFSAIPPGGVTVNASAAGFAPVVVTTFVSVVYGAPSTGLEIVLSPGTASNASTVALAPFPDLEQFVASVGSGAALLGVIALVAGFAAVATVRSDRLPLGVVGGASGVVAPLVLYYLSLSSAFPLLVYLSGILAGAGAFALAVRAIQIGQTGSAPDLD